MPNEKQEPSLDESVTYRQQFIKCGKKKCRRCKVRATHGPYWYSETWEGRGYERRRVRTKYIGRKLPREIAEWVVRVGQPEAAAAALEQLVADDEE